MRWLDRLLGRETAPRRLTVGLPAHAWFWCRWGKGCVKGTVVEETDRELVIESCGKRVTVWRHDARWIEEPLPVDITPNDP